MLSLLVTFFIITSLTPHHGCCTGSGKTYMTLTYLFSLMRCKTIRNALIVVPLSVLRSWEREASKVKRLGNSTCTVTVLTSNVSGRERILAQALSWYVPIALSSGIQLSWFSHVVPSSDFAMTSSASNPRLVITTYGLVQSSTKAFMDTSDRGSRWDYVVLDEAHTVKNPSARTSLACRSLCRDPNTRRLMLTGTPIMNNLVVRAALVVPSMFSPRKLTPILLFL
jgi:DNA excision repair protein ERCC-6-like